MMMRVVTSQYHNNPKPHPRKAPSSYGSVRAETNPMRGPCTEMPGGHTITTHCRFACFLISHVFPHSQAIVMYSDLRLHTPN